jgi:hypothetical protein
VLAGLVRRGLAAAEREVVDGKMIEIARVGIKAVWRRAIKE